MKKTKQTVYRNHVAQRVMSMSEIVTWVKDEQTREKLTLFREKLRRTYPDKHRYVAIVLPVLSRSSV